ILADGQKIYVPTLLEAIATESTHNSQIQASSGGDVTSLIPINTASQAKLETLPGIGEKRAADLIELRPYQSLDELKEKGGLSDSIIEDIRDFIIF
ncbi:MAG: helix-hairpin-helix domain-containing protein, partial [Microgenomates group bacterium]